MDKAQLLQKVKEQIKDGNLGFSVHASTDDRLSILELLKPLGYSLLKLESLGSSDTVWIEISPDTDIAKEPKPLRKYKMVNTGPLNNTDPYTGKTKEDPMAWTKELVDDPFKQPEHLFDLSRENKFKLWLNKFIYWCKKKGIL